MSSVVKSPSDSFAVCFSARWQANETSYLEVKRGGREGSGFFSLSSASSLPAKLHFDICVFDAARSAPVGAAVGDPASGSFYILCGLRTLLSPGLAAYSFSPPSLFPPYTVTYRQLKPRWPRAAQRFSQHRRFKGTPCYCSRELTYLK